MHERGLAPDREPGDAQRGDKFLAPFCLDRFPRRTPSRICPWTPTADIGEAAPSATPWDDALPWKKTVTRDSSDRYCSTAANLLTSVAAQLNRREPSPASSVPCRWDRTTNGPRSAATWASTSYPTWLTITNFRLGRRADCRFLAYDERICALTLNRGRGVACVPYLWPVTTASGGDGGAARGKSVSGISAVLPRGGCRSCWQVESGTDVQAAVHGR